MQHRDHPSRLAGKSPFAIFLIALLLLLNALAASEPLHKLIHRDADRADHECAITMFAHGHVDLAAGDVPVVVPTAWLETTPRVNFFFFSPAIQHLPPGRGPPVFSAVS